METSMYGRTKDSTRRKLTRMNEDMCMYCMYDCIKKLIKETRLYARLYGRKGARKDE